MRTFHYQIQNYHGLDEWIEVEALDSEHAAEIAAEKFDVGEMSTTSANVVLPIASQGKSIVVFVRGPEGFLKTFSVTGQFAPVYTPMEVKGVENEPRKGG